MKEAPHFVSDRLWLRPASKARCLVSAMGCYKWKEVDRVDLAAGEVTKADQAYILWLPDGRPIAFADVMSQRNIEGDKWEFTCAIMTHDVIGAAAEIHTRMSVALPKNAEAAWLDPALTDDAGAIQQ